MKGREAEKGGDGGARGNRSGPGRKCSSCSQEKQKAKRFPSKSTHLHGLF